MPYPNEHSARLKNPKDFDPESFRRTNGGTIYGSKKVPKTIAIIWAKLKGKSKPSDKPIPQALRFPTKNWTVQTAKAWLKKNKISYQSFEAAKKKEKQSMTEAPATACIFNDNAEVSFAQGDDPGKKDHFHIVGYSGGIIKNHWFWGNVAFDLAGMKFRKRCTPVLAEHFRDVRIGFSTKQEKTDQVIIEGPFLDNAHAQDLRADMLKGFPMEASLQVRPSVVEYVKDDANVKVNGQTLKGPGAVFRQSTVMEVSMCVFGADSKTKSSAYADKDSQNVTFSLIQENTIMAEEQTQNVTEIESVESFAEIYPELHSQVFSAGKTEGIQEGITEGKNKERALFVEIQKACGEDHALMVRCFSEGKTAAEAMKLHAEKLGQENTALAKKVTDLQNAKPAVDAAQVEFTDGAEPPGGQTETGSAGEEALKKEFAADANLRAEFGGDEKAYIAFKKAEANDQVRTLHSSN